MIKTKKKKSSYLFYNKSLYKKKNLLHTCTRWATGWKPPWAAQRPPPPWSEGSPPSPPDCSPGRGVAHPLRTSRSPKKKILEFINKYNDLNNIKKNDFHMKKITTSRSPKEIIIFTWKINKTSRSPFKAIFTRKINWLWKKKNCRLSFKQNLSL